MNAAFLHRGDHAQPSRVRSGRWWSVAAALGIGISLSVGCGRLTDVQPRQGRDIVSTCPAQIDPGYYFPAGGLGTDASDATLQSWFSQYLKHAGALPLWCGGSGSESYRLMYLPSFRPALLVSLSEAGTDWAFRKRWVIRTVRFADPHPTATESSNDPLRVIGRDEIIISDQAARGFFEALARSGFWSSRDFVHDTSVEDGIALLVEARQRGLYHVSTRINARDEPFHEMARQLIRLAKLPVPLELEEKDGH